MPLLFRLEENAVYLGWYDPDKTRPAFNKMGDALAAYNRKFPNRRANTCLCHPTDAAEILAGGATLELEVKAVFSIPRHTYYIGVEESE